MSLSSDARALADVAVRIDVRLGPRQPAAVDEAGVVLGVGEDRVAAVDQRRERAGVGGEAGGEDERRLGPFELGQPPFQLGMQRATGRRRAGWPPGPRRWRGSASMAAADEPRIGGEAEVVVRREVDERTALKSTTGPCWASRAGSLRSRSLRSRLRVRRRSKRVNSHT